MKKALTALAMCFSMFSTLPVLIKRWDDDLRRRMLRYFPLLGCVIGGISACAVLLMHAILPKSIISAAIIAVLPIILTGAIHVDGFMDVSDAVLSRRPLEERLRILKDPHCGAFAVIAAIILFIFMLAGAYEAFISGISPIAFIVIPAVSRACSLIAVSAMKPLTHSQYFAPKKNKTDIIIGIIWLIAILGGATAFFAANPALSAGMGALIASGAVILGYGAALMWAAKSLGGISGDVSGFALTFSEAMGLTALGIMGGLL